MSFKTTEDEAMSEINMTPMVDIMLVLLVIFMITIPVMQHSVTVNLPQATSQAVELKPNILVLVVQANGQYLLDDVQVSIDQLPIRLMSLKKEGTVLHIQGDKQAAYEHIAKAMSQAQLAGIEKIGFITEQDTP